MEQKGVEQPVSSSRARAPLPGRRTILASALTAVGGFVLGRLVPRQRGAEVPSETADLGAFYHQWSKPGHGPALGAAPDWGRQPPRTKTYPAASRVPLPDPSGWQALSLEQTVGARRSVRDYAAQPLTLDALSRLLHAAQGITEPRRSFRAAPSAGALYPIELYPVVRDVAGLEPGIYHYAVQEHALELVQAGDSHTSVMQAGLGQAVLGQAAVCFVLSAIFQRTRTGCTHPRSTVSAPPATCCWRPGTWGRICAWRPLGWGWEHAPSAPSTTTTSTNFWGWTGRRKRRYTSSRWAKARITDKMASCPTFSQQVFADKK